MTLSQAHFRIDSRKAISNGKKKQEQTERERIKVIEKKKENKKAKNCQHLGAGNTTEGRVEMKTGR